MNQCHLMAILLMHDKSLVGLVNRQRDSQFAACWHILRGSRIGISANSQICHKLCSPAEVSLFMHDNNNLCNN